MTEPETQTAAEVVPFDKLLVLTLGYIRAEHERRLHEMLEAAAEARGFDLDVVQCDLKRMEWIVPRPREET